MGKLTVVGMGPGDGSLMTQAARDAIQSAHTVLAAPRHRIMLPERENIYSLESMNAALDNIGQALEQGDVAVCVSGDPGLYSMLGLLKKRFPDAQLSVLSGVGSLQHLCDRLGESRENAAVLSAHGRELPTGRLVGTVAHNCVTLLLLDETHGPQWLCDILIEHGFHDVQVAIGDRLSYPEERIASGTPEEMAKLSFSGLCVARVMNPKPVVAAVDFGLADDAFIRGDTPMTKSEVRAVALSRLGLKEDAVIWDIGAGTGSVSMECAWLCRYGVVHAVERDAEALGLIEENRKWFGLHNLIVHAGEAPAVLAGLPAPTHVFVGGSGGELADILAHVASRGPGIRVVTAAVTLETVGLAVQAMGTAPYQDMEIVQITASRSRKAGKSHLMIAQNPVTLFSAWTGECR